MTTTTPRPSDPINPDHYQSGGMEAIDVIEAFFPDSFHLGNAFKYIARAGKKGDVIEDLKKSVWYIQREIERLEDASEEPPTWEFRSYDGQLIAKRVDQ